MAELSKRPRDLNQWQKLLVNMATGFAGDKQPTREEQGKEPATLTADGYARAEKLSAEKRLALARKAVQARWYRPLRQNRRPSST